MKRSHALSTSLLATAAALLFAPAALAQDAAAPASEPAAQDAPAAEPEQGLGDIIVTAQKRSESVRNVPVAISAFGGEALERANITQIFDLPRLAPSLRVDLGARSNLTRITIRGIGSSGGTAVEPSVGSFVDGVYIPREGMAKASYYDIDSIEVLRGPQGTLFGRNASVGAISLHTAAPNDRLEGRLAAEYGSGERYKLEGFVNVPVSDNLSVRFAGTGEIFNGLYINRFDGKRVGGLDTIGGRFSAKWQVSDTVTNIFRASFADRSGNNINQMYTVMPDSFPAGTRDAFIARYAAIGSTIQLDPFRRSVDQYVEDKLKDRQFGFNNTLSFESDSGFTVNSISAYQKWNFRQYTTGVFSAQVPVLFQDNRMNSESYSQEFQLISPTDLLDNHLSFVGGLYYFHEKLYFFESFDYAQGFCDLILPGNVRYASCVSTLGAKDGDNVFHQTTDSIAAYGQATVHIVPTLDMTLGVRWSQDDKKGTIRQTMYSAAGGIFNANEFADLRTKNSRPTYRANLTWKPSDAAMLFATYSTGYKSGGFNSTSSGAALGQGRLLRPETVKSYEVGIKTNWFDRRLQLDVIAYQMDLTDFQDRSYNGASFAVVNAGSIRNKGIEFEAAARPFSFLRLNAGLAYLDSVFTDYPLGSNLPGLPGTQDLTGTRPTFSPKWTGSAGAEINGDFGSPDLTWRLHGDVSFTSKANINTTNNNDPNTFQAGYALLGARFTIYGENERWSASIFGQNLTDKGYCTSFTYQPLGSFLGVVANGQSLLRCNTVAPPRTFGAALSVNF